MINKGQVNNWYEVETDLVASSHDKTWNECCDALFCGSDPAIPTYHPNKIFCSSIIHIRTDILYRSTPIVKVHVIMCLQNTRAAYMHTPISNKKVQFVKALQQSPLQKDCSPTAQAEHDLADLLYLLNPIQYCFKTLLFNLKIFTHQQLHCIQYIDIKSC